MINRRNLLSASPTTLLMASACDARAPATQTASHLAALQALEARNGGRLGVCVLDTKTGAVFGHRLDERFALCSTFKLPLAALILNDAEAGRIKLTRQIAYAHKDLIPNSPITRANVSNGAMTVEALAHATQTTSDNTAANLLLSLVGGPQGLTAKLRALGDRVTRIDRDEPAMSVVLPGDPRDTTSPRAIAITVSRMLTTNLLSAASRAKLIDWMIATQTGRKRLRAGLPAGWRAGDKTGTGMAKGMTDKYNDIAIAWPTGRAAPIIIACFFDTPRISENMRDSDQRVLADVGRIVAQSWSSVFGQSQHRAKSLGAMI